jgi:nitrate reductase NapAB chaperone NapD
MPISGLVITFKQAVGLCEQTAELLRAHAAIELGAADGNKLAIVVESASKEQDQEIWNWVRQLPMVADVSVAFIGLDDDEY